MELELINPMKQRSEMKHDIAKVIDLMIKYSGKDVRRINHALKVYGFAAAMGRLEGLDKDAQLILEAAAVLHDIGIKVSEEKHHSSSGEHQQIEGPPIAEAMLKELEFEADIIARVCYLIAHHHTYHSVDGVDYQILIEADFFVNIDEDGMDKQQIASIRDNIFKTKTGTRLFETLYI